VNDQLFQLLLVSIGGDKLAIVGLLLLLAWSAGLLGGSGGGRVVTTPQPVPAPQPVPTPTDPPVPTSYPEISLGAVGSPVTLLQQLLGVAVDGEFGPNTDTAVRAYQATHGLDVDGTVGTNTWAALLSSKPAVASPAGVAISSDTINKILQLAGGSPLAHHSWSGRGVAPAGYIKGIAVSYANAYAKWKQGASATAVMAAAASGNSSTDALSWYAAGFSTLGMSNATAGSDALRHTFVLLTGLGMRESSGRYCCGRDMSASNVTADTAEAGLFQQSWNSRSASPELPKLFAQYSGNPQGFLSVFQEGVTPQAGDLTNYGSGDGAAFQALCKSCPDFAVEAAAIGLRTIRQHWGPINRQEAELRPEADQLFQQVQALVDAGGVIVPSVQPPTANPPTTVPTGDPPWLAKARTYIGKTWSSGNPPQWMLDLIDGIKNNAANRNTPGFAAYCDALKSGYRPWCGIFIAGCLAAAGLPVPFVQGNDLLCFAWAPAYDTYGTPVTDGGRAGDIQRYEWHGGGEHVTFYEGNYPNDDLYHILGGNQGNAVNIKTEPMDDELAAFRRPPAS
jgi:peptidoglycan hydrolase-like protein with peptidoglycan-binding domain